MKNCLIMGFGRSGTSLMGGILHQAGYYMGEDLYPPRNSNPKGFFENALINGINERLLSPYGFTGQNKIDIPKGKRYSPYSPGTGHRWLSYIPEDIIIDRMDELSEKEIRSATSVSGYAYKDPRFNYTLGIWNQFLEKDTIFICMFRQPDIVVESVITECANAEYLSEFFINRDIAFNLWLNSYRHLLNILTPTLFKNTLFIHYEQLLLGEASVRLSEKLGVNISSDFVEPKLNRSKRGINIPTKVKNLYNNLCKLSGYEIVL